MSKSPAGANRKFAATPRSARRVLAVGIGCLLLAPVDARAQIAPEEGDQARLHLGPLGLTPRMSIESGFDSNIFHESTEPKSDLTFAFVPAVQIWLRGGPVRVSARSSAAFTHYQRYSNERSIEPSTQLGASLPVGRATFFISGSIERTRERPGYEIAIRPLRVVSSVNFGAELRTGSKTYIQIAVDRDATKFAADVVFLGTTLRDSLDRRADRIALAVRRELTSLTTVSVTAERQQDVFDVTTSRASDIFRVTPAVEFKPRALLTGRAQVGYLRFRANDPRVVDFTGLSTSVDLASTIRDVTRVAVQAQRDLAYSFDALQAYYVSTGIRFIATHRLADAWDLTVTVGHQRLKYPALALPPQTAGGQPPAAGRSRTDTVPTFGGGLGHQFGRRTRFTIEILHEARRSDAALLRYEGIRASSSISHVF